MTFVDDDDELRTALRAAVGLEGFEPAPDTWPDAGTADDELWAAVQGEVRRRAAQRRGMTATRPAAAAAGPAAPSGTGLRISSAVRRLPPAHLPAPTSARLGVSTLKRLVRRLTDWEVRPLAQDLDALRTATVRALEAVEAELRRPRRRRP